jgi:hypothetical protein
MITVVVKESDLVVTVLCIYDGKLLDANHIFDRITILVEGAVAPHHVAGIQSRLQTHEYLRYRDINRRYVSYEQVVYDALEEWGYRFIKQSIVYNIDYTGAETRE